jgi:hypothetical protein
MNLINHLGVGTVASTKQTNTNEIMVYLPSMAPAADGRVVATAKEVEKKSENAYGEETTSRVLTSNTFPAVWRSMGDSNRITPPDVREGSKVSIYQVSGQNTYYWTTFGINAETMRLETVVMGYQANPQQDENTPFNIDNFYTMTVSTHEGFMALRTTQSNGEKAAFEVKVDGMNGRIMMGGSGGNFLVKDDVAKSLTYVNADKTIFQVEKKNVKVYAKDSVTFNTDENFNILTKMFNLKCKNIAIEADTADIRIGKTKWTGDIDQTGDYKQAGDYDQTGDYTQKGDYDQTGNIKSSGTIHADVDVTSLVSLNYHLTSFVQSGSGESGPPVL